MSALKNGPAVVCFAPAKAGTVGTTTKGTTNQTRKCVSEQVISAEETKNHFSGRLLTRMPKSLEKLSFFSTI